MVLTGVGLLLVAAQWIAVAHGQVQLPNPGAGVRVQGNVNLPPNQLPRAGANIQGDANIRGNGNLQVPNNAVQGNVRAGANLNAPNAQMNNPRNAPSATFQGQANLQGAPLLAPRERITAEMGVVPGVSTNDWRFRNFDGRWWYFQPDNSWVVWHNGQWLSADDNGYYMFDGQPLMMNPNPTIDYSSGYRGMYNEGYYDSGSGNSGYHHRRFGRRCCR